SLHPDVAIAATVSIDENRVLTPSLSEVELTGAVRARIRGHVDQTAFCRRLVVLENLLQPLEAAAPVHKWHAAVVRRDIDRAHSRVHTCTGHEIEGRHSGEAANSQARWRAAVDILFVAEFVIVIGRVIALPSEKWLKTILAADVYRKKLLAIFAREIIKQLRIGCARHRHRRVRN